VAQAAGLPDPVLARVRVVLEEAVSNVARHGFPPGGAGEIEVVFRAEPPDWVLAVSDDGIAFDPTAVPARTSKPNLLDDTEGGWGLGLIRHYCAGIAYRRQAGRNHLTLRFAGG